MENAGFGGLEEILCFGLCEGCEISADLFHMMAMGAAQVASDLLRMDKSKQHFQNPRGKNIVFTQKFLNVFIQAVLSISNVLKSSNTIKLFSLLESHLVVKSKLIFCMKFS